MTTLNKDKVINVLYNNVCKLDRSKRDICTQVIQKDNEFIATNGHFLIKVKLKTEEYTGLNSYKLDINKQIKQSDSGSQENIISWLNKLNEITPQVIQTLTKVPLINGQYLQLMIRVIQALMGSKYCAVTIGQGIKDQVVLAHENTYFEISMFVMEIYQR